MPIEVHCPNPSCAKVHFVKNKYAGMRGKCPACASWMFIPKSVAPSVVRAAPRAQPEAAEEEAPAWRAPVAAPAAPAPARKKAAPAPAEEEDWAETRQARPVQAAQPELEEEAEAEAEAEAEVAAARSGPYFSWLPLVFFGLGLFTILGVSATPFVEQSSTVATGDFSARSTGENRQDILANEQMEIYVLSVPGAIAAVALVVLLIGLIARKFGFLTKFLAWLTTVAALLVLLLVVHVFRGEMVDKAQKERSVAMGRERGLQGDVTVNLGLYLWLGLGSAGAATLFFLLGTMFMYRQWLASLIVLVAISLLAGLGVGAIYAPDLGLGDFL